MKGTAIIRWTGRGSVRSFETSVRRTLQGSGLKARVRRAGESILVEGAEPVGVAKMFGNFPGVRWIAVGKSVSSLGDLGVFASALAVNYLRPKTRFSVLSDATGGMKPVDLTGIVASAALGAVKGARIDEQAPQVVLRAAFDGGRGALGVQLGEGPGGTPTGAEKATCLVSGGKHSSVVAWMALLSGFSTKLVHARVSDESVKAVARLYSELSNRVDYSKLTLEVIEGPGAVRALIDRARRADEPVLGGFHHGCSQVPAALRGRVESPLAVLVEERFDAEFQGLGLVGHSAKNDWKLGAGGEASYRAFGHARADLSEVLDGLSQPRPLPS